MTKLLSVKLKVLNARRYNCNIFNKTIKGVMMANIYIGTIIDEKYIAERIEKIEKFLNERYKNKAYDQFINNFCQNEDLKVKIRDCVIDWRNFKTSEKFVGIKIHQKSNINYNSFFRTKYTFSFYNVWREWYYYSIQSSSSSYDFRSWLNKYVDDYNKNVQINPDF